MRETIRTVLQTLIDAGYEAYVVGGYVRDALMGRELGDADVTTNATPEEVESLFEKVSTVGKVHGTIVVLLPSETIEVTTYRLDGPYGNHRHPQQVTYTSSLAEDLARRDFTVNAMTMAIDGTVTDVHGGKQDLQANLLRAIGDPHIRLQEDALRILRAIRFQSVLGFTIESSLLQAMMAHAGLVAHLSKERILSELRKMLQGDHLASAVKTYQQLSLPTLPASFVIDTTLTLVEQFAIASLREGFAATEFPWTKQEVTLLNHLLLMDQAIPNDVTLYDMADAESMVRVGHHVYEWPMDECMQRFHALPIHSRKDLKVNGHDLMELGFHGPAIDEIFREIELAVLSRTITNERQHIILWIQEKKR